MSGEKNAHICTRPLHCDSPLCHRTSRTQGCTDCCLHTATGSSCTWLLESHSSDADEKHSGNREDEYIPIVQVGLIPLGFTFSSEPSLQSSSPSQSHSLCRHSWLFGHRSCAGQRGGLTQFSSSEWSLQSGYPSHLSPSDTHWPLAQRYWWLSQAVRPGKNTSFDEDVNILDTFCHHLPHFSSSEPSAQSLSPSHRKVSGIQRNLLSQRWWQPSGRL